MTPTGCYSAMEYFEQVTLGAATTRVHVKNLRLTSTIKEWILTRNKLKKERKKEHKKLEQSQQQIRGRRTTAAVAEASSTS